MHTQMLVSRKSRFWEYEWVKIKVQMKFVPRLGAMNG